MCYHPIKRSRRGSTPGIDVMIVYTKFKGVVKYLIGVNVVVSPRDIKAWQGTCNHSGMIGVYSIGV